MAPKEYSLRIQKGITGGFAPPTPSYIATITRPLNSSSLNIEHASRQDGTANLGSFAPKTLGNDAEVNQASAEKLVDELHDILKSLPTEQPPGSEDIYGLDTSIFWGSDDLTWVNGGMGGGGGVTGQPGSSTVQPTTEQKAQFKRAVEIVQDLVGEAK